MVRMFIIVFLLINGVLVKALYTYFYIYLNVFFAVIKNLVT